MRGIHVFYGVVLSVAAFAFPIFWNFHSIHAEPALVIHGKFPTANAEDPVTLLRKEASTGIDQPSGALIVRIPANTDDDDGGNPFPPAEGSQPPSEPSSPSVEDTDVPTFFGEKLHGGNIAFVLDISDSMRSVDVGAAEDSDGNIVASPTRLQVVKFEVIQFVKELTEENKIGIVLLAGYSGDAHNTADLPIADVWKQDLVTCTEEVKSEIIEYVQGIKTRFGTPTHKALHLACTKFEDPLDTLYFLSDGAPYPRQMADGKSHKKRILKDFPTHFSRHRENGCKLSVIHIGNNIQAGTFMQDFAAQNGATYIHR